MLSVFPGDVDRIMDADASVGRAPASGTHCPCLTHSRGQGLWLVSRGRRLRARETLAMQGIRFDDWSWSMSSTQIIAAAGNSMSVPILKLVFKELVRCTGNFQGPADPRLAFESRRVGLRDGVERNRQIARSPTLTPEVSSATGRSCSSRCSALALPSWLSDTLLRLAALTRTAPAMWASFTSTTLRARVSAARAVSATCSLFLRLLARQILLILGSGLTTAPSAPSSLRWLQQSMS